MTLLPAALVFSSVACGDDDDDDTTTGAGGSSTGGNNNGGTSNGGTSNGGTSAGTSNGGTSAGTSNGGTSNGGDGGTAGTTGGSAGTTGGSAGATQAQSDAQLAGILSVINTAEVAQGKLAETKGLRSDVVDYGTMMDTMHTANQTKLQQLLQTKGITPSEDSLEAQTLKTKGDPVTFQLNADPAKSATFDDHYIQSQIDGHNDALNMLDTVLIPKAQDAELKAHFTTTRGDVVMHLDHAKMLKSGAGGMGGSGGMSAGGAGGAGGSTAAGAGGTTAAGAGGTTAAGAGGSM